LTLQGTKGGIFKDAKDHFPSNGRVLTLEENETASSKGGKLSAANSLLLLFRKSSISQMWPQDFMRKISTAIPRKKMFSWSEGGGKGRLVSARRKQKRTQPEGDGACFYCPGSYLARGER